MESLAGGMCAIEMVRNRETKEPAGQRRTKELGRYCYEHGLITITAGTYNNIMRILVPLVITDEQMDEALDVMEAGNQRMWWRQKQEVVFARSS